MARFYLFFALADLALMVAALIDCLSVEEFEIRALPRVVWVLLILLFSPIGGIAWFVAGRPQRTLAAPGQRWRPGSGFPEYERPVTRAPDDDPEFLAGLNRPRRDEESLRRWEADLKRREEELRRRDRGGQDGLPRQSGEEAAPSDG